MLQFDLRVTVHKVVNDEDGGTTQFDYTKETQDRIQSSLEQVIEQLGDYGSYFFTIANSKLVE